MSLGGFIEVTAWLFVVYVIVMALLFWHEWKARKQDKTKGP